MLNFLFVNFSTLTSISLCTVVNQRRNCARIRTVPILVPILVGEEKILYGLEAESISGKRLTQALEKDMVPLIGKSEDLLRIYELKQLNKSIKDLIVHKVT